MFGDRLKLKLTLLIGSDTFSLPTGSLNRIAVDLTIHGFEAEVEFFVDSQEVADPIFPDFSTSQIIQATLTLANGRILFESDAADPLTLMGYVTEKRVREVVGKGVDDAPVVGRHYFIRFFDPAQVFWRQHKPFDLYVQSSLQDVIDAYKAQGMTMTYDWGQLDESLDVLCIGLGGEQDATFYDLVMWYVDRNSGVFELTPGTGGYRFGKTKAIPTGDADVIDEETVDSIRILVPEPKRHSSSLRNPFTEAAVAQKDLPNPLGVSGVRVDPVVHTWIQKVFDARVDVETFKLVPPDPMIEVTYKAVPDKLEDPGTTMNLSDEFPITVYPSGNDYRLIGMTLRAQQDLHDGGAEEDLEATTAAYQIDLVHRLELTRDATPRVPPYRRPRYPVFVEGRVLSASGAAADRTWYPMEDEATSLFEYRINVPLWNKIVVTPFIPDKFSGHFFFPAYKNQRVLLALEFDSARVDAYLEWAIPLSKDTQGDQLILGFNDTSHTYLTQVYTDDKPVVTLARVDDADTQTVTISEGDILMVVKQNQSTAQPPATYDVTPNVAVAKAQTQLAVGSAISDVTGKYEESTGAVMGSITGAQGEVSAKLSSAQASSAPRSATPRGSSPRCRRTRRPRRTSSGPRSGRPSPTSRTR